jgi:hypothetical protein
MKIYGNTETLFDEMLKAKENIRSGIFRSAVTVVATAFY